MTASVRLVAVMGAILLASCIGPPRYMKMTASLSMPDAKSAVVRFLRPRDTFAGARTWAVLDGEKAIGTLSNGTQFDYVTTPGKHLFIFPGGWPAKPYFLEADLLPGKTYYVYVGGQYLPETGVTRVALLPITRSTKRWNEVPTYEKDLMRLEPDLAGLEAWSAMHREETKALIRTYHEKWKHEGPWATIAPDDGV